MSDAIKTQSPEGQGAAANAESLEQLSGHLTAHGTPVPERWKSILVILFASVAVSFLASFAAGYSLIWHLTVTTSNVVVLAAGMGLNSIPGALLGPF
ncbi:MAG: hypothetical protein LBI64_05205, partial [Coriobacteriales bacterium]|nr:hypothetical protein [Coriobacteriales bacterium]